MYKYILSNVVSLEIMVFIFRGNFIEEYPYIAGSPCSACPSGAEHCVDRLCMTEGTE